MTLPLRRYRSALPSAVVAALALLAGGCGSDEGIRSYSVPRTPESTRKDAPAGGDYRLLGLMVPAGDPVWFFKLSGTAEQMAKHEADFDKLAASVQLPPNAKMPDFTPPAGWVRGPGRGTFVAATIKAPDGLEVSVTSSAGGVEQNLGRWVGQIGLKPGPGDATKYTRTIDAAGVKVLRVDLTGPKDPATARGPMMGGGR
jgi:hypothetical protein